MKAHGAVASFEFGTDKVNAWLTQEPDVGGKLGAMLRFIRTMTLTPEALGADDVRAVRAAGVSDAAFDDALHVALMFNIINRVADGLGFEVSEEAHFVDSARALLRFGYEL